MRINMKYVRIFLSPIVFVFVFISGFLIPFYILFFMLGIIQVLQSILFEEYSEIKEGFMMMICFLIIPYYETKKFINNEY